MSTLRHTGVRFKKGLFIPALAGVLAFILITWLLTGIGTAQETETEVETERPPAENCMECHRFVSADVVNSWQNQNHGRADVGCPICHNTHVSEFRPEPQVAVCGGCHEVDAIHPGFSPEDEAAQCMECHAANVHLPPGQGSWLEAGLPPERLTEDPRPASTISEPEARIAAGIVVVLAVVTGLIFGLILDRFVRNL